MTIVHTTHSADIRKAGCWLKVGVVAEYLDPITETLPQEEYPIAQFRYRGEAMLYAKALAARFSEPCNLHPPVAVLVF